MSKSVDETVFDFFELLLHENDSSITGISKPPSHGDKSLQREALGNEVTSLDDAILAERASVRLHQTITVTPEVQFAKVKAPSPNVVLSEVAPKVDKQSLEKLLAPVLKTEVKTEPKIIEELIQPEIVSEGKPVDDTEQPISFAAEEPLAAGREEAILVNKPETQLGITPPSITKDLQEVLDDEFQVLFFKVAGLTLAVPLVSLGGIVKVERINHIIGRPSWFLGVQSHREEQLNIVDTCAWVMPEKYTDKLAQSVNYQYLVLLEGSNWGLTCESLVNAVKINKSQVNWRSKAGKRPWLAGVVKEQMCGILHVQALVEMLDAGLGCQDSIG